MNTATSFVSALKSAIVPAAIAFITILLLVITIAFLTATLALLSLLIPILSMATKAAILGYPLFLGGTIAFKMQNQFQIEETSLSAILSPGKPRKSNQTEPIQNNTLITPPSDADFLILSFYGEIPKRIATEILEASQSTEVFSNSKLDTTSDLNIKPINNQLALPCSKLIKARKHNQTTWINNPILVTPAPLPTRKAGKSTPKHQTKMTETTEKTTEKLSHTNLKSLTTILLKRECKHRNLKGYSKLSKSQLIELLTE